jgi:nucleoid-associated protein YgaU
MARKDDKKKAGTPERDEALKRAEAFREKVAERQREGQAGEQTYVVEAGDSLSKIAKEFYGDASRWPEIFEANKDQISDPNVIRVGQKLHIPPK